MVNYVGSVFNEVLNNPPTATADSVAGLGGNDTLFGGIGSDTVDGGTNDDVLDGGADADLLVGGTGNNTLDGGTGDDTASYGFAAATVFASLADGEAKFGGFTDLLAGIENLVGSTLSDVLEGEAGNNDLTGSGGDDSLHGGAGNDSLLGDAGADVLQGGTGNDTLDGGADLDTAIFQELPGPVAVDLDAGTARGFFAGQDAVIGVETVFGTGFDDTLAAANRSGAAGGTSEELHGLDGNDLLIGRAGPSEALLGDAGNDTLDGGADNDVLSGGGDDDRLSGGAGNDLIDGGSGSDTADFSQAGVGIVINLDNAGAQSAIGEGNDTLAGIEHAVGSDSADTISGSGVANRLEGGEGDDRLAGLAGSDTLLGDNGDDVLSGGGDGDTIDGGDGVDLLQGGDAADSLSGGLGDDVLNGDLGDDTCLGGTGDDRFNANPPFGGGNDLFDGGEGLDTVSYSGIAQAIALDLALVTAQDLGAAGLDTLLSIEGAIGGFGNDTLRGESGANSFIGGGGSDLVSGLGGNDTIGASGSSTLEGGEGDDSITGFDGSQVLRGGAGNDVLGDLFSGDGDMADYGDAIAAVSADLNLGFATSGAEADLLVRIENLLGSRFDDTLRGEAQGNRLDGGNGGDLLVGRAGADTLLGGKGSDMLRGATGNDELDGGASADTLHGGSGSDRLTGGTAADIFLYQTAQDSRQGAADTIFGFTSGSDRIDLSAIDTNPGLAGDQGFAVVASRTVGVFGEVLLTTPGLLLGFIDGDVFADLEIILDGAPLVLAADLIL